MTERDNAQIVNCDVCPRKFRRKSDMKRHKCLDERSVCVCVCGWVGGHVWVGECGYVCGVGLLSLNEWMVRRHETLANPTVLCILVYPSAHQQSQLF